MVIYKCDRCGEEINERVHYVIDGDRTDYDYFEGGFRLQLCKECYQKTKELIMKKE